MALINCRVTKPWTADEYIYLGHLALSYESSQTLILKVLMPGGGSVNLDELYQIGNNLKLRVRLPQKVRFSHNSFMSTIKDIPI